LCQGDTLKRGTTQLGRLLGEAGLIIVSVYVAIVLEGASSARSEQAAALESLRTVQAELEADLVEARAYATQKEDRSVLFAQLAGWLSSDVAIPVDSFDIALEGVLTGNFTIFPRRAAWSTMISAGQLASVGDPVLVNQLADLYEHWTGRVLYNGEAYDEAIWEVTRNTIPSLWDRREGRFLRSDLRARRELDGQLLHLEIWNASYGRILTIWADEIENVLLGVDMHLQREGDGG
jgi:hypothetical protein